LTLSNPRRGIDSVPPAIDIDRFKIHSPLVAAYVSYNQFGMRALTDRQVSVLVENVSRYGAAKNAPITGVPEVDAFICANFEARSCR
jgi:hypothetical protein